MLNSRRRDRAGASAVASYVQHLTPVNNVLAPSRLLPLPRVLLVTGALPFLPAERMRDAGAAVRNSLTTVESAQRIFSIAHVQ